MCNSSSNLKSRTDEKMECAYTANSSPMVASPEAWVLLHVQVSVCLTHLWWMIDDIVEPPPSESCM